MYTLYSEPVTPTSHLLTLHMYTLYSESVIPTSHLPTLYTRTRCTVSQ